MGKKVGAVGRPVKSGEYVIKFANNKAQRGWVDLVATQRNAAVDAWDFLTRSPEFQDERRCYPLKGRLAEVVVDGVGYRRWQYKPTIKGSARIWYAVHHERPGGGIVYLERVDTSHPNETK